MERREFIKRITMIGAASAAVGAGAAFGSEPRADVLAGWEVAHFPAEGVMVSESLAPAGSPMIEGTVSITNHGDKHVRTIASDGVGLGIMDPGETIYVAPGAHGVFPIEYEVVDLSV